MYQPTSGPQQGFVRTRNGTITTFAAPDPADIITPVALSTKDIVVGYYSDAEGNHGFLRAADGTITTFDVVGAGYSGTTPSSINSAGTVTGDYQDNVGGAFHGFVRMRDGTIKVFDVEIARDTLADSINSNGVIAGTYLDGANNNHAFLRLR